MENEYELKFIYTEAQKNRLSELGLSNEELQQEFSTAIRRDMSFRETESKAVRELGGRK